MPVEVQHSLELPQQRRPGAPVAAGFALALALAALSGGGFAPAHAQSVTMVQASEPPTLVSLTNSATTTLAVSAKVTEGLLEYDEDLNPKPLLATAWSISPDGKVYSFTLREGVKWHDGKPFTAEDVVFSLNLLKKVHPRGRSTFANISSIAAPDARSVVITLSQPAAYLIRAFASTETPIVPKHIYEGSEAAANPNGNAPIGTGPFKFKEWQRGNYILYERNPDYWGKPEPGISQLVVKIIPDAAARSIAFESGSVDFGYRTPVALSDLDRLKKLPNLRFETRGASYSFNVTRLEFNLDNPYFKDKRVRQAVAHAIDRKVILNTIHYGYGTITHSPIAPGLKAFHDPTPSPYAYDLKAAAKLLDDAGFKPSDGKTRFRLTLDFNPITTESRRLAEYIRAALSRIGIAVDLRAQDISVFVKRIYTDRDFDFVVNGASNLFDPSIGVQRLYWSKSFLKGVPFSNATHYANPEVDRLLEHAAGENDPKIRIELFRKFQNIVAEEIPDLNLISPSFLTLHNTRIHDLVTSADGVEGNLARLKVK